MSRGITVVVPAYNSAETIGMTLQALLDQEFDDPLEILIIDDCSTDATSDKCKALGLEVVRNSTNMGLAASLNRGILLSKNGIIVTLHPDVIPLSKDWLKRLVEPLSAPGVGASCSLQHPPDCESSRLTFWEELLWCRLRPHYALNNKADAYKKDVLIQLGVFDQLRFHHAGEDEDLALRLRLKGMTVASSSGEVIHNHRFGHNPDRKTLGKILAKEYSWGGGGGALRRKFPRYKPGAYIYPIPKSPLYDGLFRVALCMGAFIPFLGWVCIPSLLFLSCKGIGLTAKRISRTTKLRAYPILNLLRYWSYTIGYIDGFASGTQK